MKTNCKICNKKTIILNQSKLCYNCFSNRKTNLEQIIKYIIKRNLKIARLELNKARKNHNNARDIEGFIPTNLSNKISKQLDIALSNFNTALNNYSNYN